jgi:hypothetical protein
MEKDEKIDDRTISESLVKDVPLIFISHDSRDLEIAESFSKLLSSVTAGMLKSFRSSDKKGSQGFEYGVEWYPELMKTLGVACDVVCLLTERSVERPWLLYEAGVAKGKLDTTVHGLALGIPLTRINFGPFQQFQNCDGSVDSITKLVMQLIGRLPNADPDLAMVRSQVEIFVSNTDGALVKSPVNADDAAHENSETSTSKLFEEIKVMFQDLPMRIEKVSSQPIRTSRRTPFRMQVEMINELSMVTNQQGSELGLAALMYGSILKEEFPWLQAMGGEVYRASITGNRPFEARLYRDFFRTLEFCIMGPFSREFRSTKEAHYILQSASRLLSMSDTSNDTEKRKPDSDAE